MYFDLIFFFHSLNFSNSIIMTALDKWMFSTRHKLYTSWLYRYNVVCPRQGIWWCVFLIYLFFSFLQPKFINPKLVANRIVLSMPFLLTKMFHYIVIIIVRCYAECFLIRGIKMGITCYLINIRYRQINCYDDNLLKFKQRNIACLYYGQLCTMKNRYSLIFGSWIPIKTKYWLIFYLFLEFQVTVRMIIPASTSKPKNIFPRRL